MIALVDCNNFFVSCERVFRPELQKKPVVVLSSNDGCIVARSNEAKKLGVPMGAPVFHYKELFDRYDVTAFSSNFTLYGDFANRIVNTLLQFAPDLEVYSIDESFLSFNTLSNDPKACIDYCKTIKRTVMQYTGIPVSIGIGKTKTLAKVANYWAKRGSMFPGNEEGVFFLLEEYTDTVLAETKVEDLWGVGRKIAVRLRKEGIVNALQLKAASDELIRKKFTIMGLRLVHELRGIECLSVEEIHPAKKSITTSRTFGKYIRHYSDLEESVTHYASKACEKLRKEGSLAQCVMLYIRTNRYSQNPFYSQSGTAVLSVPTSYTPDIITAVKQILKLIYRSGFEYSKSGVILTGLVPEQGSQRNFFEDETERAKRKKLMKVMDAVNKHQGRETLFFLGSGIERKWSMKKESLSKRYTTRWDELLEIKI
jgi:DNA polymerase V